ncbi:methionine--tRNA ligase [Xenorhabdus taiwanensis]|uniref:Methionyl-tRNA synthetase n=1 Tax=Xenorhabdus taiwanensis TaxID=3085177 RepID=A0ABM8K145_9GAMM|nr:methionine--tRNA ligase [Xenorhabdus sp. TCT-1]
MAKFIVTATPPTPNGDLHLGHLSGPFLAADVMQRRLKQLGHDVLFVTYSDDYQSYLPRKTQTLRRKPFAYARLMCQAMKLSLELVNIHFDTFMQAADTLAYQHSGEHYTGLIADQIELKAHKTFYCATCNLYGYEGFGRTQCNWCGTSSDTSQCEHCARVPDIEKITTMTCMSCQGAMQPVQVKQHIWKIGQNYPAVKAALQQRTMRSCLASYLDEVLSNENEQWPLTRPGDTGMPVVALDNYPLHTWFLGLSGYRSCVESYLTAHPERGDFSEWWAPDTELVHFLGFDCSYSHAVGYSSLLLADQNGPRPGTFITNRFLKLDGEDFSTSRGHAVWLKDLAGQYPSDAIRLFSALTAPETAVSNFSREQFQYWYHKVFLPLVKQAEQITNSGITLTTEQQQRLHSHSACLNWQQAASLEAFSIAGMARSALDLYEFIQSDDVLSVAPEAWQILAKLLLSLCPDLAGEILSLPTSGVQSATVFHEPA